MHQAAAADRGKLSGAQSSLFCTLRACVGGSTRGRCSDSDLSLNAARLHATIRVSTAPLIISYISLWSSAPRRTRTFPTVRWEKCFVFVLACSLKISISFIHLFIYFSARTSFGFRSRSAHYSGNHFRQANQSHLHRLSLRLGSFKFMRPRPDGCPHWPCQGSEHASVIRAHSYWTALH